MITNIDPINYKGYLIRENDFGKSLILEDKKISESKDFVIDESINALEINSSLGFTKKNLDFLNMFTSIKHINIVNHTLDINGLYFLNKLETLYLGEESKSEFDFSYFKYLKRCSFTWRKKSETIFENKNINWLSIAKFPFENLDLMSVFENLNYLGIGNCKLTNLKCSIQLTKLKKLSLSSIPTLSSLDGLSFYQNLEVLDFYDIKNLSDIEAISQLMHLKKLSFENCKKLGNINPISNLTKLKTLYIDNCEKIESLKPVEKLNELTKLHFIESTNITDGDLKPIFGKKIKSLYFRERKHYSNKKSDFNLDVK